MKFPLNQNNEEIYSIILDHPNHIFWLVNPKIIGFSKYIDAEYGIPVSQPIQTLSCNRQYRWGYK